MVDVSDHDHNATAIEAPQPDIDTSDTVTLWRPVGQAELDLVAASGWRAWAPPVPDQSTFCAVLDRRYAVKISRERIVPAEGVGYVTRFAVERSFLERYESHHADCRDEREYLIPAAEVADLNAHIIGAIMEDADYRGPVGDSEFTDAEAALGRPLPGPWRSYLQGRSWFRRGWMTTGEYVWLNTPREMLELHDAWADSTRRHPGIAIIGGDGSREQLVLDLRSDPAPVLLVDIVSDGWGSGTRQANDVGQLIDRIETGEFAFDFEE
ncbi:hypothetical protein [Polymorphospora rubra]|uniref:Knr4/Smi1-like domain-containing protein n=1 Tax=Polymorphospora rubra TaxID=338584 RepID=A0A810MWH2_9ACTN|nr:hypothetical protein [Polymorphospora rubra]BCJ64874.1 hypothetical protein Prubr_18950 [Polymorphospora rubra]